MINENHSFLKLSAQMADLCNLIRPFGIHHFTYLKQYQNGKRISLSNKPSWIADYYNLDLYKSSLFEKPFEGTKSSFDLWFSDYDLDVYRHGKLYYNTMHSISIVEYQSCSYETWLFATTPDNAQAIHYLSNNREILYHFILYLKDEGRAIFKSAEKSAIVIPETGWESPCLSWPQDADYCNKFEKEKAAFFAKTPIHRFTYDNNLSFSHREMVCIYHLLNFKTAAETAKIMNISPRTVESYLDNIKNKLGCSTRGEVFQKLKDNPYWSAIFT
ncbi:MAG: helix-turn-helix transcriptional regulator [Tatlockia sp.]|nr:helix-turn-helix transcriptional regulator [Tatlockia sp.]